MLEKHVPCRTVYPCGTPCPTEVTNPRVPYCRGCLFWLSTIGDPGLRPLSMARVFLSGSQCGVTGPEGVCTSKPSAKGLCTSHYHRYKAHGDPLGGAAERFGRRVVITEAEYEALPPDPGYTGRGRRPVDLSGSVYGPLTVLRRLPGTRGPATRWVCRHEDGSLMLVRGDALRRRVKAR